MKLSVYAGAICLVVTESVLAQEVAPIPLETRFDPAEIAWAMEEGTGIVSGEAYLTLADGSKKGCAGFPIELLPVAPYASERIDKTYGSTQAGQVLMRDNPPKFTPDAEEYHDMLIKGECDADNGFLFDKVPAGDYFALAFIIWEGKGDAGLQGGAVMRRVSVGEGARADVMLGK